MTLYTELINNSGSKPEISNEVCKANIVFSPQTLPLKASSKAYGIGRVAFAFAKYQETEFDLSEELDGGYMTTGFQSAMLRQAQHKIASTSSAQDRFGKLSKGRSGSITPFRS